ncbi:MAG: iron-sulfur cluster assembly accessory protein [Ectothiorhodospiraceae bacterium]|nr:iron-sulfur cluster assembly accessory protein [Ectothiorhodospiraceae bacterium]
MDIITFSPLAIDVIKKNLKESEHGALAFRIAAKTTADESVEYGIGFDEPKEDDVLLEEAGFKAIVSPDCVELLNGTHIDYVEIEAGQHHFIFLNPNDPNYKPPTEENDTAK